jgi:hypothetical protein
VILHVLLQPVFAPLVLDLLMPKFFLSDPLLVSHGNWLGGIASIG